MKFTIKSYLLASVLTVAALAGLGFTYAGYTAERSVSASPSEFASRRLSDYGVHVPVGASIATTSTTDTYFQVPKSGTILSIKFSSLAALATDNTNYVTFSATNLGQAGAGSTALLSTADTNTTKTTGGSAISASSSRSLVLSGTSANLIVTEGDVIRIRATASGTLAGAVTVPSYSIIIRANGQ